MAAGDKITTKRVLDMMSGCYSRVLGNHRKEPVNELPQSEQNVVVTTRKILQIRLKAWISLLHRLLTFIWSKTFAKIGEDWAFLALLGMIMALISFVIDSGIYMCNYARYWMFREVTYHPVLQFLAWMVLPVFYVLFASGFVSYVAPQAVGSGIPEMKTILRGVPLKGYLKFPVLIAKAVGLTATLGSGMPLGKEGPMVHMSSIVGTLLTQVLTSFKGIYENETRNNDMLAAACAVGVSCSLGAPIGGVLFSIEVTSSYFAIRNYWRGFFSAAFGALMFRLLAYWTNTGDTLTAVLPTNFRVDFHYEPIELLVFALIGVFGGLTGAAFILIHRRYSLYIRFNPKVSGFLKKNRFIYPSLVSCFITAMGYPLGFGRYIATTLTNQQQTSALFANFTWISEDLTPEQAKRISHWDAENTNLFVSLGIFTLSTFVLNLLANTLPVPHGSFVPIFKMGAGFGRMIGEAMNYWFPDGIRNGLIMSPILPGGYAIVGAAAVSAGVTHTVSVCVVVSEMTGQIHHIIPILIAVLASNAVSSLLQPSLYESIIIIKKLPFMPNILPSKSGVHNIYVENFMERSIKYIWIGITYQELKTVVSENPDTNSFPLLDSSDHMVLLGSIKRVELMQLLERHIGSQRRLEFFTQQQAEIKRMEVEEREAELLKSLVDTDELNRAPSPLELPEEPVIQKVSLPPRQRKVSRFEVFSTLKAAGLKTSRSQEPLSITRELFDNITVEEESQETYEDENKEVQPIFQKTAVFTIGSDTSEELCSDSISSEDISNESVSATSTISATAAAKESKFQAIGTFLRKQARVGISDHHKFNGRKVLTRIASLPIIYAAPYLRKISLGANFKPKDILTDMSPEEKEKWENNEMLKIVDFKFCTVDPAPFQLVERTPILKVHTIFSILGVEHAYVTALGKLVGIVSYKELRKAIQDVNSGKLVGKDVSKVVDSCSLTSVEDGELSSTEDNFQIEISSNIEKENVVNETGVQYRYTKTVSLASDDKS